MFGIKKTVLHLDKFSDATKVERNGDWEITQPVFPDVDDTIAKRRGYALKKFFPELLEQVDKCIKESAKDCQNSWNKS